MANARSARIRATRGSMQALVLITGERELRLAPEHSRRHPLSQYFVIKILDYCLSFSFKTIT